MSAKKGINQTCEMNTILEQITLSVRCCKTSSTLSSDCINLSCKSKMKVSVNQNAQKPPVTKHTT